MYRVMIVSCIIAIMLSSNNSFARKTGGYRAGVHGHGHYSNVSSSHSKHKQ